jgi:hypothetical protein
LKEGIIKIIGRLPVASIELKFSHCEFSDFESLYFRKRLVVIAGVIRASVTPRYISVLHPFRQSLVSDLHQTPDRLSSCRYRPLAEAFVHRLDRCS